MSQAYDLFQTALKKKAPTTRDTYAYEVDYMVKALKLKEIDELFQGTPKEIEDRIIAYNNMISYNKANKLLAALDIFCSVNAITLNFSRLYMLAPAKEQREHQYKPYPKPIIKQVIDAADAMDDDRTAMSVETMSTGGPRIGALPIIKINDLLWLEEWKLYSCLMYSNDNDAAYPTFFSPQASKRITRVIGKRKPDDYLFFNKYVPELPIEESALQSSIRRLLIKLGIREPLEDPTDRHPIQLDHGFRKYARTAWDKVGIREDYAERLEGRGNPMVKTYSLPAVMDWMQMTQYYKAIPDLTF